MYISLYDASLTQSMYNILYIENASIVRMERFFVRIYLKYESSEIEILFNFIFKDYVYCRAQLTSTFHTVLHHIFATRNIHKYFSIYRIIIICFSDVLFLYILINKSHLSAISKEYDDMGFLLSIYCILLLIYYSIYIKLGFDTLETIKLFCYYIILYYKIFL